MEVLYAEPEYTWIEFLIDTVKKANQISDVKRQFQSPRHFMLKCSKNRIGKG